MKIRWLRAVLVLAGVCAAILAGAWLLRPDREAQSVAPAPAVESVAVEPALAVPEATERREAPTAPMAAAGNDPRVFCFVADQDGNLRPIAEGRLVVRSADGLRGLTVEGGSAALSAEDERATVVGMSEAGRPLELDGAPLVLPGAKVVGRYAAIQTLHVRDAATGAHIRGVSVWESNVAPPEGAFVPPTDDRIAHSLDSPMALPVGKHWKYLQVQAPGYGSVTPVVDRAAPELHVWMAAAGSVRVTVTKALMESVWRPGNQIQALWFSSSHASFRTHPIEAAGTYLVEDLLPGDYEVCVSTYDYDGGEAQSTKRSLSVAAGAITEVTLDYAALAPPELRRNLTVVVSGTAADRGRVSPVALYFADTTGGTYTRWARLGPQDFGRREGGGLEARVVSTRAGSLMASDMRTGVFAESFVLDPNAQTELVLDLSRAVKHTVHLDDGCVDESGWVHWKYLDQPHLEMSGPGFAPGARSIELELLPLPLAFHVDRGVCTARDVHADMLDPSIPTTIQLRQAADLRWRRLEAWTAEGPLLSSNTLWWHLEFFDAATGLEVESPRHSLQTTGSPGPELLGPVEGAFEVMLAPGRYRAVLRGTTVAEFVVRGDESTLCVEFKDVAAVVGHF